jgi:hypothetical protein
MTAYWCALAMTALTSMLSSLMHHCSHMHRSSAACPHRTGALSSNPGVHTAGKRELALRSEHSARVDEAEARCKELQATLNEQRIAYDMLLVGGLGGAW